LSVCLFCSIASYTLFDFVGSVFVARLVSACSLDFYSSGRLAKSKVFKRFLWRFVAA